jgi:hypothetical protein
MRHRTPKNKQKITRKNPNKERYVDVRGNALNFKYIKEHRKKLQAV